MYIAGARVGLLAFGTAQDAEQASYQSDDATFNEIGDANAASLETDGALGTAVGAAGGVGTRSKMPR